MSTILLYQEFHKTFEATPISGRFMPYDWVVLPNPLPLIWMPYSQMLGEFSRELANIINNLTNCVDRLKVWARVIEPLSNQEKYDAIHEFIDALATVAVNLPYAIRSRFIFATAHLCHQANRSQTTAWRDDLPLDQEIMFAAADEYGKKWRKYIKLKNVIEQINNKRFQAATHDFRNAYNHRFSPHFEIGLTNLVRRTIDSSTGSVSYGFGGAPPLRLSAVAELLGGQRDACYLAFEAFQELVGEHTKAIENSIVSHS